MGVGAYDHYSDTLFLDGSRGYTAADDIKPVLLLRVLMYMVRAEQEHLSGKRVLLLQQRIVPGVRH